jgi:hypothetical protein
MLHNVSVAEVIKYGYPINPDFVRTFQAFIKYTRSEAIFRNAAAHTLVPKRLRYLSDVSTWSTTKVDAVMIGMLCWDYGKGNPGADRMLIDNILMEFCRASSDDPTRVMGSCLAQYQSQWLHLSWVWSYFYTLYLNSGEKSIDEIKYTQAALKQERTEWFKIYKATTNKLLGKKCTYVNTKVHTPNQV